MNAQNRNSSVTNKLLNLVSSSDSSVPTKTITLCYVDLFQRTTKSIYLT